MWPSTAGQWCYNLLHMLSSYAERLSSPNSRGKGELQVMTLFVHCEWATTEACRWRCCTDR